MIQVRDATKARGRRTLWKGLSFDVAGGELVTVTGPSGSGKSTLLDCVGQLERLDAGRVILGGEQSGRSRRRARLLRKHLLGYLFQDFGLVADMTAEANVELGRASRRTGVRAAEALDRVGLTGVSCYRVHELSGGEQQRVALARLIVKAPRVILADEPTSALDEGNARMVLDVLQEFTAAGAAVLVATHSDDVRRLGTRTVRLPGATD